MKKWALWKTILVVISSIIVIAGVTVGAIFLAKGNGQDLIYPENIEFSLDDKLYNSEHGQFEVTEDFQLVLKSTTENVTQKKVTLSFASNYSENLNDGTISDGVIVVPKEVTLNEPFDVKLSRGLLYKNGQVFKDDNGEQVNWINGGISSLIATSENRDIRPCQVRVAVDVPVYSIEVETIDMTGKTITQITENKQFYAQAKFFPEASRYLYSDNLSGSLNPNEKATYFETMDTTEVVFYYDEKPYFMAGNPSQENHIVGYTFKHADKQLEVIGQFSQTASGEELYNTILSFLSSSINDSVTNKADPTNIVIIEASINEFIVTKGGHSLQDLFVGDSYTLSVKADDYSNDYLDATIKDVDGVVINSMLKNIALNIEYVRGDDHTQVSGEQMIISGRQVITIDGKDYILPNAEGSNPYWEFYTGGTYNFEIHVVLLEEDITAASGYKIFAKDNTPQIALVYLNSLIHSEKDLGWNDDSDISMSLEFNGSTILPSTISLDGRARVPQDNIYQSGIYFACFDNSTDDAESVLGGNYNAARSGVYTIDKKTFNLYALSASELTVKNTGEFELYFATVQTDNQGRFIYEDNGLYKIAQITLDSLSVKVSKSLYQGSVLNVAVDVGQEAKPVYIYEGSNQLINLSFNINEDSREVFAEQLVNNQINLKIFNALNEDISSYFTADYNLDDINNGTVKFSLKAVDSLNLSTDVLVNSVRLTDEVSELTWNFNIATSQINIYTPKVKSVTLNADIDFNLPVTVTQKLSNTGDSIEIAYNQKSGATVKLDSAIKFNELLSVEILDQHDNNSISKFNNGWTYVTDNSSVIVIGQNRHSFSFGNDGTATLWIECGGYSTNDRENEAGVFILTFNVEAQGIMAIKKDANSTIAGAAVMQLNQNSDGSLNTSVVSVVKDAKVNGVINLKNLVILYLDKEATDIYSNANIGFFFTTQFVLMDDNPLLALFGNDGMLLINDRADGFDSASGIRDYLRGNSIEKLTIRHNFAVDQVLNFNIYDKGQTGVISITFNLRIQKNISVSNMPNSIDAYAATPKTIENGKIVCDGEETSIQTFLSSNFRNWLIVYNDSLACSLVEDNGHIDPDSVIGKIDGNGNVVFDDFWNEKSRAYTVKFFADKIDNVNALSFSITFNVLRNIKVSIGEYNNSVISDKNPINVLSNDTSSKSLDKIIKVTRLDSNDSIASITLSYKFVSERPSLEINNNVLSVNNENFPFFRYNQTYLTEKVTVSIISEDGEFKLDDVIELYYNLGAECSINEIAKNIYCDKTTAKVEKVEDVSYLLVTSDDQWMYKSDLHGYTMQILTFYTENGIVYPQAGGVNHYDIIPQVGKDDFLTFSSLNGILLGLNQQNIYLIVEIRQGSNTFARMLIPIIVSSIGMDFVQYGNAAFNNLQNALTLPDDSLITNDTLMSQSIYQTVDAGKTYSVAFPGSIEAEDFGFIYPNSSKFTTVVNVIPTIKGYYSDLVYKLELDTDGVWKITLNHLSNKITDAYVALQCTVSNGTLSQVFYYLLKVNPDTEVSTAVYPYNGGREEITSPVGQTVGGVNGINLADSFDVKTLHNGEYRFNIRTPQADSLGYSYKVISVSVNGQELRDYSSQVTVEFVKDNIKITPKNNATMEIKIARVYDGGLEKSQSVVGGEIEYRFVLNSNIHYALSYEGEGIRVDENNASVTFAASSQSSTVSEEESESALETKSFKVYLNSVTSSGSSGHEGIVYGVLQAHARLASGEDKFEGIKLNSESETEISIISYNRDNADLVITRPEYVSQDEIVYVDFYTEYGYLGTLTVFFPASAQVAFKAEKNTTNAGVNISIKDTFINKVTLDGQETSGYTFTSMTLKTEGMSENGIKLAQNLFNLQESENEQSEKVYSMTIADAENPVLNIMSSTQDLEVTFRTIIAFTGTDKTYAFDFPISVLANIARSDGSKINDEAESKTDTTPRIAGNIIDSARLTLYTDKNITTEAPTSTNINIYYKWNGGTYFDAKDVWHNVLGIATKDVPKDGANIVVTITVGLSTTAYDDTTDLTKIECYQEFKVVYTFTLRPNTIITLNYPTPSDEYKYEDENGDLQPIQIEYLRDGAAFYPNNYSYGGITTPILPEEEAMTETLPSGMTDFFTSSPTLSKEATRVVISKVEGVQNERWSSDFKAYVDEMQNISVELGTCDETSDGVTTLETETGSNEIDRGQALSFHIGRRVKSGEGTLAKPFIYTYDDNGLTSYVVIRIECNGVLAYYRVQLEKNILTFNIAHANSSGTDEVETYFVNEMAGENGGNIFIDNRLLEFTLNDSSQIGSIIASNYRVVFESENVAKLPKYQYKDLHLTSDDCGKTKYVELGTSWTGYKYKGTYLVNSTNFITSEDGTYRFNEAMNDEQKPVAQPTEGLYSSNPSLTSRAQMYYMGYKVDYDFLSDDVTKISTETPKPDETQNAGMETLEESTQETKTAKITFNSYFPSTSETGTDVNVLADYTTVQTTADIGKVARLSDFKYNLNNGQIVSEYTFSNSYYYTVDIDIDVEFKGVSKVTEVDANQLITSVIEANNVYHPSNGLKLERSELNNANNTLSLEVVENIPQEYTARYGTITNKVGDTNYTYLSIAPVYDDATKVNVLDWRILGHGASNSGNYVLLKLTFTSKIGANNYTKDFYLVYQVVPDYQITYGNTSALDNLSGDEDHPIYANRTNPYPYSPANNSYNINVAGVGGQNNIVSAVHTRINEKPDVAASGFTYSITANQTFDKITYNIDTNLQHKLQGHLAGWAITSDTEGNFKSATWTDGKDGAQLQIAGVGRVVFAPQYYQLVAKDIYGYTFEVYFVLQSGGDSPEADSSISFQVTEDAAFDIGVVYEALSIEKRGSSYDIVPESQRNYSTQEYSMLNLVNIKAWGFLQDPSVLVKDKENNNLIDNGDSKYLDVSDFENIRVTNLVWMYDDQPVASLDKSTADERLATRSSIINSTDTNGETTEQSQFVNINGDSDAFRAPSSGHYIMPKLPGWVYGTTDSIRATMMIELTYTKDSEKEVYRLPVEMTVNRNIKFIVDDNNAVRDGESFKLSDYVQAKNNAGTNIDGVKFYNDTLEISLPSYTSISLTLTDKDGKEYPIEDDATTNNLSYTRTQYISISETLGRIVNPNETFSISVTGDSDKALDSVYSGYLVRYNGRNLLYKMPNKNASGEIIKDTSGNIEYTEQTSATFTISLVETDKINIATSQELSNSPVDVTKSYLAKYTNAGTNYVYRLPVTYQVTSNFYSMSTNYAGASYKLVDKFIRSGSEGNYTYIVPLMGWTDGMTLNLRQNTSGGGFNTVPFTSNFNQTSVYFMLTDETSSGAATMTGGQVTTTDIYDIVNHFISVAVYCKASGLSGDFSGTSSYDKLLGTVTFKLDSSATFDETAIGSSLTLQKLGVRNTLVIDGFTPELPEDNYIYQGRITNGNVQTDIYVKRGTANDKTYIRESITVTITDKAPGETDPPTTTYYTELVDETIENVSGAKMTTELKKLHGERGKDDIQIFLGYKKPAEGSNS